VVSDLLGGETLKVPTMAVPEMFSAENPPLRIHAPEERRNGVVIGPIPVVVV